MQEQQRHQQFKTKSSKQQHNDQNYLQNNHLIHRRNRNTVWNDKQKLKFIIFLEYHQNLNLNNRKKFLQGISKFIHSKKKYQCQKYLKNLLQSSSNIKQLIKTQIALFGKAYYKEKVLKYTPVIESIFKAHQPDIQLNSKQRGSTIQNSQKINAFEDYLIRAEIKAVQKSQYHWNQWLSYVNKLQKLKMAQNLMKTHQNHQISQ